MDGNTEDLQKFVPQVHFEQIPIKNLCSNQDYQRNLSIKHVQRAAANFDLYQINPVKVSRRDGINYVFNGQQHYRDCCSRLWIKRNSCLVYGL